jgi:hypothetical protein
LFLFLKSSFAKEKNPDLKMSTKLLRRLLQQTSDVGVQQGDEEVKKKNKRQKQLPEESEPLNQDEIFNRHVQSMLLLDTKMASRGGRKKQSMQRITAKQKRESSIRKQSSKMVVGNTRGTSSVLRRGPEPTSDKKKHNKEKEEKKLREIAKLLKKQSKPKK